MILDANVLIAALDPSDRLHAAALELLGKWPHTIHMVNMGEVVSILTKRNPTAASVLLDECYHSPFLAVSNAPVERVAGVLHAKRPSPKVSLADCIGMALALATSEPFATSDGDCESYVASDGLTLNLLGR